jgi:hypothetical protein
MTYKHMRGICDVPVDTDQYNLLGTVGTFAAHHHSRAPSGMQHGAQPESIP